MIENQKITVVMPAYNAEKTLRRTVEAIPAGVVDDIILVDDCSRDGTEQVARELGLFYFRHAKNLGYGGNQKTCYRLALERGADIVIMLHPDYQYDPRLVPAMAWMLLAGPYDLVLASRLLGNGALQGGMPYYKFVANRCLTMFQNLVLGQKLSEYHTGYRAYRRRVLETLPLANNSDDFVFDNQFLCQAVYAKFCIGEISCSTKYFEEASSISFRRSAIYGLGVLKTCFAYLYARWVTAKGGLFDAPGQVTADVRS